MNVSASSNQWRTGLSNPTKPNTTRPLAYSKPVGVSPRFGEIYGILGEQPPELTDPKDLKPFPYEMTDPKVDEVYAELKRQADAVNLDMDYLIVTRKGAIKNGQPVCRELRLVFTEDEATILRDKWSVIASNMNTIEKLQKQRDEVQLKLRDLNEKRQGWDYGLYGWFGSLFTSQGASYAKLDREYAQAQKTLKSIGIFANNADEVYKRDTLPFLKEVKKALEGYITLPTLQKLMGQGEFDIKKGSDLSLPPFAYWWHKTENF